MDKIQLGKLASKKGIRNPALFVAFIIRRFPDEGCESYVVEWADRFLSGNPIPYMDSTSKSIYVKCIDEYEGEY